MSWWKLVAAATAAVAASAVYVAARDSSGRFDSSTTAQQVIDEVGAASVRGKRLLVTGCTPGGIGYETARVLACAGASVLVHARSEEKARAIVGLLAREPGVAAGLLEAVWFDQASLEQVVSAARALAAADAPLHGVVLNAGLASKTLRFTDDGFELTFGVNHLAPMALFLTLLPKLIATGNARVVWLSSLLHAAGQGRFGERPDEWARGTAQTPYSLQAAYAESKLATTMVAQECQRRFGHLGVTSASVAPGLVHTNLTDGVRPRGDEVTLGSRVGQFLEDNLFPHKTLAQGAATSVFVMATPDVEAIGGRYCANCKPQLVGFDLFGVPFPLAARRLALDREAAAKFFDESERLVRPWLR